MTIGEMLDQLRGATEAGFEDRSRTAYEPDVIRALSTPVEDLTVPPVDNLTDRRGDEPQFVVAPDAVCSVCHSSLCCRIRELLPRMATKWQ